MGASIALHFATHRDKSQMPAPAIESVTQRTPPAQEVVKRQREPAPTVVATNENDASTETNVFELSLEKIAEFLQRHNRNASSLLAAYHAMHDTNMLNEAAEKFPNDPYVQWAMLTSESLSDADRRKWLDAFKTSSPDNSLADYLSAAEHFNSGNRDAALKEITEASGKALFKDFTMEAMIDEQELRRGAGQSAMLAIHGAGWAGDLLQELSPMKAVAKGIADAQKDFKQSGDSTSADNLVQMGLLLAGRLNGEGGKFVLGQMVGDAIESRMLAALDPNTKYESLGGKTPDERKAELKAAKEAFKENATLMPKAYGVLNESEWVTYSDRMKTFGEREALRWLKQRLAEAESK